ncbi:MAG: TrmH family RNA methyltransferase [Candidatus Micrarchaeota archaeon]
MEFTGSRKVKKPLPVRVVLVSPEYSMNVGMACRAAKNFSVVDLAIVRPKCALNIEAEKYAKHSKEVYENAKICDSLDEAIAGFDLVIGTTGVVRRFANSLKNCVSLPSLKDKINGKKIAIVFGSEGNGLTGEDLQKCDVIATIPAERAHPVLNLSHSVAVTLYALFFSGKTKSKFTTATTADLRALNYLFCEIVDELKKLEKVIYLRPKMRDPDKAKVAFKRVFGRTNVAQTEAQTIMATLARVNKALKAMETSRVKPK